jgi:hypothetical protein
MREWFEEKYGKCKDYQGAVQRCTRRYLTIRFTVDHNRYLLNFEMSCKRGDLQLIMSHCYVYTNNFSLVSARTVHETQSVSEVPYMELSRSQQYRTRILSRSQQYRTRNSVGLSSTVHGTQSVSVVPYTELSRSQ